MVALPVDVAAFLHLDSHAAHSGPRPEPVGGASASTRRKGTTLQD